MRFSSLSFDYNCFSLKYPQRFIEVKLIVIEFERTIQQNKAIPFFINYFKNNNRPIAVHKPQK